MLHRDKRQVKIETYRKVQSVGAAPTESAGRKLEVVFKESKEPLERGRSLQTGQDSFKGPISSSSRTRTSPEDLRLQDAAHVHQSLTKTGGQEGSGPELQSGPIENKETKQE